MTPSHIAAILRLDEKSTIQARAWDAVPAPVPKNRAQRRHDARRPRREAR